MKEKLSKAHQRSVSLSTISRHLRDHGHRSVLPINTPMLTTEPKQKGTEWAKRYQGDDCSRTIFTDESSFQLFRNIVQ